MASYTKPSWVGPARSGRTNPGRTLASPASPASSASSTRRSVNGTRQTARQIMKGVATKASSDPYPGLDAILKKARKLKPFSDSDKEQRLRALYEMVPTGILAGGVREMVGRMEMDYLRAVSAWRADNWLVPVSKETEFPYSRTRNLGDAANPDFKYGSGWLPRPNSDSGANYDGEGERLSHSDEMENIDRAAIMRESDLRIKGIEERDPALYKEMTTGKYADMLKSWGLTGLASSFKPRQTEDAVLLKMKSENESIRSAFDTVFFDRYEEVWNTWLKDGYTISGRYRAFKLFSKQQYKLLQEYEAAAEGQAKADAKRALLAHADKHGELVRGLPDHDSKVKPKVEAPKKLSRRAAKKAAKVADVKL